MIVIFNNTLTLKGMIVYFINVQTVKHAGDVTQEPNFITFPQVTMQHDSASKVLFFTFISQLAKETLEL